MQCDLGQSQKTHILPLSPDEQKTWSNTWSRNCTNSNHWAKRKEGWLLESHLVLIWYLTALLLPGTSPLHSYLQTHLLQNIFYSPSLFLATLVFLPGSNHVQYVDRNVRPCSQWEWCPIYSWSLGNKGCESNTVAKMPLLVLMSIDCIYRHCRLGYACCPSRMVPLGSCFSILSCQGLSEGRDCQHQDPCDSDDVCFHWPQVRCHE